MDTPIDYHLGLWDSMLERYQWYTPKSTTLPSWKLIGVPSYGALGYVPPSISNNLFFSVHFESAQSLTAAMWIISPNILQSVTAAVV